MTRAWGHRRLRAPWVADESHEARTCPTVAAVASPNWPSHHDANFAHPAKFLKANTRTASSHIYCPKLPTRLPENAKELTKRSRNINIAIVPLVRVHDDATQDLLAIRTADPVVFATLFTLIEQLKVDAYVVSKLAERDFGDDGTETISVSKRNGVRLVEEERLVSQAFQPKRRTNAPTIHLRDAFAVAQ
jgi:hypothetical protein